MIPEDHLKAVEHGDGYVYGDLKKKSTKLPYVKLESNVLYTEGINQTIKFLRNKMPIPLRQGSSDDSADGYYHLLPSFNAALDIFENNPQSITHFDEAHMDVHDVNESGTQVEYDVTGDFIDMGRYMEGVPETFGAMHNGNARNRRATIIVAGNNHGRIHADDVVLRAERIVRLVDALENNGVRTEVKVVFSSEMNHFEIQLKHHDEALTVTDLAVVCHPDWHRRVGWRIKEYSNKWQSGYGYAGYFNETVTPEMIYPDNNDELAIFIGSNMRAGHIPKRFEQVEKIVEWELSKSVPEIACIMAFDDEFGFRGNGVRPERDIIREGVEVVQDA